MHTTSLLPSALALLLTSTSLTNAYPASKLTSRTSTLTASALLSVAPKSNTCTDAKQPLECRTANQALGPILNSFATYHISDVATQAAVLSTLAFESGDFKYALHYFPAPDHPGQGTRNMQGKAFNDMYAKSIVGLPKSQLAAAQASADGNAVVKLLIQFPDYDFGSGAWFLTTQCNKTVVDGLKVPGKEGFNGYLACIGTEPTDGRMAYYQRALDALGVKAMA